VTDAQQLQDAQVLLALGLPTLVGGHHEHGDVDRAHAGEHVLDEALVSGNVVTVRVEFNVQGNTYDVAASTLYDPTVTTTTVTSTVPTTTTP
jgi:hypothetical protein